jgi:ornithine cyclodeaminase/alanine dehydrogenase-like protein (mu-crystallin family)
VFDGSLLAPGAHVNAVGSNSLARAEIDLTTVARAARIVVDSLEQARMEAGDLLTPVEARRFRWEQARELREIVAGGAPGRQYAEEITLFKSVGVALEDVAAASLVYDRAQERGIGREIEFWQ